MNRLKAKLKNFINKVSRKQPFIQLYSDLFKNFLRNSSTFPKITIVVPLYNEERFIHETINSIRQQNYKSIEVIVVNDASTDNSARAAEIAIENDSRFRIITHDTNKGLAASRNTGINNATGEYITFLDADDCLVQHTLWHRFRAMQRNHSSDIAGSYCVTITTPENFSFSLLRRLAYKKTHKLADIDFMSCKGECPFNAHAPLLKTAVVKKFTGFNEDMRHGCEDWEFWLRIMRHGYRFIPSHHIGAIYRQKNSGMIHTMASQHYKYAHNLIESAYQSFPKNLHITGTPFIYKESLSFYQETLVKLRRATQFAAIGYMTNGKEGCAEIIPSMPACPRIWLRKHLSIPGLVEAGIRRYLKLSPKEYVNVRKSYLDRRDEITQLIWGQIHPSQKTFPNRHVGVLFIPHNAYHTYEMSFCLPYLKEKNISYMFINVDKVYKNEGVEKKALELELPCVDYSEDILDLYSPKAIFVMNDWGGVVAETVKLANDTGIPTVGLVEGVQDYLDTHVEHIGVGHKRKPYQTVKHPLVVGDYDTQFFNETKPVVVGSPRIENLLKTEYSTPARPLVCINSNFTDGVYTNIQKDWVEDVVLACNEIGVDYVISKHPADKIVFEQHKVTDRNLYEILSESSLLVSRFSGAILESMAIGTPVIYYNPHGERVDCFKNSLDAYPIAKHRTHLAEAMTSVLLAEGFKKRDVTTFFDFHVYTHENTCAGERIGRTIAEIIS